MTPIARLQEFQIGFIMAVITVVVAVMSAMSHDDVIMFLRHDHVPLHIQFQLQRLVFLVAGIAVQARGVSARADQVCRGNPRGCGADEIGIHQRKRGKTLRMPPEIEVKGNGENNKTQAQESQHHAAFRRGIHLRAYCWILLTIISLTFVGQYSPFFVHGIINID
jgi:hypothetical protein